MSCAWLSSASTGAYSSVTGLELALAGVGSAAVSFFFAILVAGATNLVAARFPME